MVRKEPSTAAIPPGGVINLVTRAPTGDFGFKQSVDFGNRNMFRILSSVDAPRWHGIEAKATVLISAVDGYVKNLDPAGRDYGQENQRGGRLQLRYDGLSALRADYFFEKSTLDSTPAYDTNPALNGETIYFIYPYYANPFGPTKTTYRPVNLPLSTSNHTAQGLTVTWKPTDAFVVQSLTGYRTLGADANQDYAEFAGFAEASDDIYTHRQFSQEVRVSGDLFSRQLSYLVGASYFNESGTHLDVLALPSQGRRSGDARARRGPLGSGLRAVGMVASAFRPASFDNGRRPLHPGHQGRGTIPLGRQFRSHRIGSSGWRRQSPALQPLRSGVHRELPME